MLSRKISGRELIIIRGIPIYMDFVDIINEIEKSMKQKIHEIKPQKWESTNIMNIGIVDVF